MRLPRLLFLTLLLLAAVPSAAWAQADAQQSYEAAKTALQAGQLEQARDLAQKAAQTDPDNPEVHLLLGKAHYGLGELDEAIAAWKRTLRMAPEEPYAKQMLDALGGNDAEIGVRIKLIEVMLQERLLGPALAECGKLLGEKALTDPQRVRVITLQADLLVRSGKYADAQKVLQDLLTRYPEQADPVRTTLLLGQAKLRGDDRAITEGLALLKKTVADHPDTPAAALAQYELIAFELRKQGVTADRTQAMAVWLAANGDHELAAQGRQLTLDAYLTLTGQGAKPTAGSDLSPTDVKALALMADMCQRCISVQDAQKLATQMLSHLKSRYGDHGALGAAQKGIDAILAASLPREVRRPTLSEQARYKTAVALKHLDELARTGKLPQGSARGQLLPVLSDVLATYDVIDKEFPATPSWAARAQLAGAVRGYSPKVLPAVQFGGLNGPDAWTLDIALPVVRANADAAAVKSAVGTVQGIIQAHTAMAAIPARKLAMDLALEVASSLPSDDPNWPAVITSYYTAAAAYTTSVFQENIKTGHAEANATLAEHQKTYLATLKKHLTEQTAHAPHALVQLAAHVKPWVEHGHWAVAEEVYATIAPALPEKERLSADLAVVNLWIRQATEQHQRLTAPGLTVPRELDPLLKKALVRCCELQAGLDEDSAVLGQVRAAWNSVIAHYKKLEYFDVAEAAIRVRPESSGEAAEEYAAFQLALLNEEAARRAFTKTLAEYGASEKIALGPEFEAAIGGWTKFIADRPASPFAAQAVERIFGIGSLFQQHSASDVAAGIYGDLAKFAAGIPILAESPPGGSSTAQRAGYAVATALDAKARKSLAKLAAERKSDDPPPAKISEEFAAAIAAFQGFAENNPDGPLAAQAIGQVMAVALEYAKIDAWEAADSVYAGLLDSGLAIRRPQRLTFCRGLCQLGGAMPDHARALLSTVTTGGLHGPTDTSSPVMLAGTFVTGASGVGGGGGGFGGGGMGLPGNRPADPVDQAAAEQPVANSIAVPQAVAAMPARQPAPTQPSAVANRDVQMLAMIQQQESSRASQVAQLRERITFANNAYEGQADLQQDGEQMARQGQQQTRQVPAAPVLSEAELARQEKALLAAYAIFESICKDHPHTVTAGQARGEILVMIVHWRTLAQWERSAALAVQFLADHPTDPQLPKLRLEIARDRLAWASKPIEGKATKQQRLAEVSKRFDAARAELAKIVADFPGDSGSNNERQYRQDAQWDIAGSFLSQARVVGVFSPTLARGQYVRTTRELSKVAADYPDHPKIGTIPQMLWDISIEVEGRGYFDEAILAWGELTIYDPMHALAQQAALKTAQTYHQQLKRPLRAAQAYQELNFARGGNDQTLQNAIFQIGSELKNEKRWVESLHVLETFVDSFPRHPQAGQALTMVGQIHQTNEAWKDAIAAYTRVIAEFENGQFVQEAKWSIAQCTINLSQWREAGDAYREYVKSYAEDAKVAEANRRIEVLKDLARYQGLVDEPEQRKAFDAQFQIAAIVAAQLSNPVKAIIEYRKVVTDWSDSHLADDALYAVGTTYLSLGETEKAREALLAMATKYATSPLADDALYAIGKSYEDEAGKLATVTRASTIADNKDIAQRRAYRMSQSNRYKNLEARNQRVADLKKAGKGASAEVEEASLASNFGQFNDANVKLFAQKAFQEIETLTATQLADRQDKINAALREAVAAYQKASRVAAADKADEALLQMATIYDQRLKDSKAAMDTWLEIVRQFSGTSVAEDASWRIAQHYERENEHAKAIEAYKAFLRNYRGGSRAGAAQFAIAENYEQLGEWVNAMDSYSNYVTNFPEGPLVEKAKSQINWIKTYRL